MRFNFMQRDGALHVMPSQVSDLSSVRLALQVGAAVGAPFVLALATQTAFQQPGAGLLVGGAFGTMLVMRTAAEAGQMDAEHRVKIDHARELSRIEVKEREARLPKRSAGRQPRPAIAQPVPDPEEQERVLLAEDVRFVFEMGVRKGTFARRDFIQANKPRLQLPSGIDLTRPRFEMIIQYLLADRLLVRGNDGSPRLPGGQVGGQLGQGDMPIIVSDPKRVGESA